MERPLEIGWKEKEGTIKDRWLKEKKKILSNKIHTLHLKKEKNVKKKKKKKKQ